MNNKSFFKHWLSGDLYFDDNLSDIVFMVAFILGFTLFFTGIGFQAPDNKIINIIGYIIMFSSVTINPLICIIIGKYITYYRNYNCNENFTINKNIDIIKHELNNF